MSYKIAVASSDGIQINLSFGEAEYFDVYEVEKREYHFLERRVITKPEDDIENKTANTEETISPDDNFKMQESCNTEGHCGCHNGCNTAGSSSTKVMSLHDCRCVVCKKIGFHVTKQLEKQAIIGFDVTCSVNEALSKIANYLTKVDAHESLRGMASNHRM